MVIKAKESSKISLKAQNQHLPWDTLYILVLIIEMSLFFIHSVEKFEKKNTKINLTWLKLKQPDEENAVHILYHVATAHIEPFNQSKPKPELRHKLTKPHQTKLSENLSLPTIRLSI